MVTKISRQGPRSSVPARPRPRAHLTFGTHDPRTGTARHAFIYSSSPQVHASRPATAARRPPRDGGPPPSPTHHRTPPKLPPDRDEPGCGSGCAGVESRVTAARDGVLRPRGSVGSRPRGVDRRPGRARASGAGLTCARRTCTLIMSIPAVPIGIGMTVSRVVMNHDSNVLFAILISF